MCEKAIFTELKDNFVLIELKVNHMTILIRCSGNLSVFEKKVSWRGRGMGSIGRMRIVVSLDSDATSF